MGNIITILAITSPKVFNWLGHKPVINWTLSQLDEVRGINKIICVTTASLFKRTFEFFSKENFEICSMPESSSESDVQLDQWLIKEQICKNAETIVVIKPSLPFLPAPKIENCIDLVRRRFADIANTVRLETIHTFPRKTVVNIDVPGCHVFAPDRFNDQTLGFRPIQISLIESLDITNFDSYRIAKALVAEGLI